jgi:hypothetical protein
MIKLLYKPASTLVSVLGGILTGVWRGDEGQPSSRDA